MPLLTVDEVSALTRLEASTLYTRRARDLPPRSFKIAGRVVYDASEVQAWIASQQETTSRGASS